MKEIFKNVKGYEGIYQVSNLGNVKSLNYHRGKKEKILKPGMDLGGYLILTLCKNRKRENKTLHRLVAIAFIPNPENKATVNHINGVKTDNCVSNLEWNTYSENHLHAHKTGLMDSKHCTGINGCNSGEKSHLTKLNKYKVMEIKDLLKSKLFTQKQISEFYNCSRTNISSIKTKKAWGYIENDY
jgi:hypothetical protein